MVLQKTGDNDGEVERKPTHSPILPPLSILRCITVTEMSNQPLALNTEVPVSCFLSSLASQV